MVRDLSKAEHPRAVETAEEAAERKWQENERFIAKEYRSVEPEDMEKESEAVEAALAAKKAASVTGVAALDRTEKGRALGDFFGLTTKGCAGLTVIEDPEAEGGKAIGSCESEKAPHFCPECRQRFCDACFGVKPGKPGGECPTCEENPLPDEL